MHYFLSADQKAFFEKQGFIEFEGLVSEAEVAILKRCKAERDSSRADPQIEKIVYSSLFAKIASELSLQKRLRFGYDEQYFLPIVETGRATLNDTNSIRGLVSALMICLEGESDAPANSLPFTPFPQKPGNATIFLPTLEWDYSLFSKRPKQRFLLITYATTRAMYVFEEKDPHTHALKRLGYVFGDRLGEACNPILSR